MEYAPGPAPETAIDDAREETVNGLAPHPDAATATWIVDLRSRRVVRRYANLEGDHETPEPSAPGKPEARELLATGRER